MNEDMIAWRQDRYGGPEIVLRERATVPHPAPGGVVIAVRAVSLNAGDVRVMRGDPLLVRLAFGLRAPRVRGRGMDVAGVVTAVGEDVTTLAEGDEVVGELAGDGLAEYVAAPAGRVVRVPDGVSMTDAATLPVAAGTAWQALDAAAVPRGGRVLIIGASGGVGTFAVQLAVTRGLRVSALCGQRSRALIERLGAEHTADYRRTGVDAAELTADPFDAVLVIAGAAPLRALQRLVRDGGAVVMVSGDGGRVLGPVGRILRAAVLSIGSRRRIRSIAARPDTQVLARLLDLVADGSVAPVIERTWPLADAGAALAHVDAGRTVGKVLVTVP